MNPMINGICCNVCNCKFHEGECGCTAGEINVGGQSAYTAVLGDTAHIPSCVTFQPKSC